MSSDENWRSRADRVLDDYERGVVKERITQGELARRVGVSRQTLWRDAALRERFRNVKELRSKRGNPASTRASADMRIRALQGEVVRLHHENGLLIQNIVVICRKLREHGLDPRVFVGEAAEDAKQASTLLLDE